MTSANKRIVAMVEKEQEHRHRLQKTPMETWSRLVILKMCILTICSAGVFSIGLLCIIRERLPKDLV